MAGGVSKLVPLVAKLTQHISCGHTRVKTRLPVRSVLFKHPRALPSIVVGDHTRTEGAAVFFGPRARRHVVAPAIGILMARPQL